MYTINGLPVKNSRRSLFLTVTGANVRRGRRKDPTRCPAVLGAKDCLNAKAAHVHLGRTYLQFNGYVERFITSKPLRDAMVAYDKGGKFAPGEYVLHKMEPHRDDDHKRKRKSGPRKTNKGKKYKILKTVRPHAMVS